MSKISKCLKELGNQKLQLNQLQDLIYNIDSKKYKKAPKGYYCTNIQELVRLGILAKKNTSKYPKYYLTKLGKKNINKPYAKNIEYYKNLCKNLSKRNRELYYARDEKRIIHITKSNEYYYNKYVNLQNQLNKLLINS
tara:strand:+ start:1409 stop:1822 length:414 start_codon:yes stop_codon:yes gene_type:complete